MDLQRFMASQFRQPSGWFGSLVMTRMMNRINRRVIESTLLLLELEPENQVLEIGFGGGIALELAAKNLRNGVSWGVDFSPDMVRRAERKFLREIEAGRVRVQFGDVSQLAFPDASFDRVFTINTIYFWPDARQGLGEIRRVLKDGGRAAVAIRSKEKMEKYAVTKHGFQLFSADELAGLLREAGFQDVRADRRDQDKWYDQVIVTGIR